VTRKKIERLLIRTERTMRFRKHDSDRPEPPTMSRSKIQAATVYSPGVLFTFEGGRGICQSVPVRYPKEGLSANREKMIYDGITEFAQNWLSRARLGVDSNVPADLCLDQSFIRPGTVDEVQIDRVLDFELTEPSFMGYEPFPLVFQCQGCLRVVERAGVGELAGEGLPDSCKGCGGRTWRQVDVVFAHWSGSVEPLSPYARWWNAADRRVDKMRKCRCEATDFALINKAPAFSEWQFRCMSCGETRDVVQMDAFSAEALMPLTGDASAWRKPILLDVNMLPVSSRASSLHYVQTGRFIAIEDAQGGSWLELFAVGRSNDLLSEVARIHSFSMKEGSDAELRDALIANGKRGDWRRLEELSESIAALKGAPHAAAVLEKARKELLDGLIADGSVPSPSVDSQRLGQQMSVQETWSRKRNPVRLTIEHRAFVREHIERKASRRLAVDLRRPDRRLYQLADEPSALETYQRDIAALLARLGVHDLYFIRNLPVVEYSFAFTRVCAQPVYERAQGNGVRGMPVRLRAFPRDAEGRRPVYVLEQENEAIYVRLQEDMVRAWLEGNGVSPDVGAQRRSLGAAYLEDYEDFGEFLDDYKVRVDGRTRRGVPNYVFMLLHSMSHLFVQGIADMSGLEADGIGEQVYPADLAFVVYRKGMTPDLGNLSAMWRNHSHEFLRHLLSPRSLACGSGSLCDHRGGACPACLMTADVSCAAYNQLLSRAALSGGRPPMWEAAGAPALDGYFQTCARGIELS
jgi:hypothetical protein